MLLLKRVILLLGFIGLVHHEINGQSSSVGNWLVYFGNQKINDKWNIQSDFQYRDYQFFGQRNQLLARAGLGYNLKPQNHNLLLGYAYIATDSYDEFDLNGTLYVWNGEAWTVVANVTQGGGGGAAGGGVNMAVSWWFGV